MYSNCAHILMQNNKDSLFPLLVFIARMQGHRMHPTKELQNIINEMLQNKEHDFLTSTFSISVFYC
jgi:hypothetical protein